MAVFRVYDNWERLVRGALLREQLRSASQGRGYAGTGLAGDVPASLGNAAKIDAILQAADDIEAEDPNVARILCEQAWLTAQNLDPNSEGRGVLLFKTGLMTVIMLKHAKKDGVAIDRQHEIERLWKFYLTYKRRYRVDIIQRMEARALEMKKVYATLRALIDVLEILVEDSCSDGVGRFVMVEGNYASKQSILLGPLQIKKIKKSGATFEGELIPIDAPSLTNVIGFFPEVGTKVMVSRWMSRMKQPKRG